MKILVVENSEVLCQRLLTLLATSGRYEVTGCVDSTQAALYLIDITHPDGVLLDLHLNESSGFRLLEILKERNLRIPVIVLSESCGEQYRSRACALGAKAFLSKSGEFEKIIPTLDRLLHAPQGDAAHRKESSE